MTQAERAAIEAETGFDGDERFRPQFRVLTIDGARKGFRLEAPFWDALDMIARRKGRSTAAEVQARLAEAPAELNHSSALRASLARELLDLWAGAEGRVRRAPGAALIAALPTPSFSMSNRSVLLSVNEPLLTYLNERSVKGGIPLNTVQGAHSLTVEAPPSAIVLLAESERRFVTCNAVFVSSSQRYACRVRLVQTDGAEVDAPVLIGFLLDEISGPPGSDIH